MKKIIYALIAVVTLISVLVSNTGATYAASFNDNLYDAPWHYYECSNTVYLDAWKEVTSIDVPDGIPEDFPTLNKAEYTEHVTLVDNSWNTYDTYNITLQSDSEMVVYFTPSLTQEDKSFYGISDSVGHEEFYILSSSVIHHQLNEYSYSGGKWVQYTGSSTEYDFSAVDSLKGYQCAKYRKSCSCTTGKNSDGTPELLPIGLMTGKMKVFNTMESALIYLETGEIEEGSLSWEGSDVAGYDGNIKFNKFDWNVHDSNIVSNYYIDFTWELPDDLLFCDDLKLNINETFRYEKYDSKIFHKYPESYEIYGNSVIDLKENPFGCRMYITDFYIFSSLKSIDDTELAREVLGGGSEVFSGSAGISLPFFGFDLNLGDVITKSQFSLDMCIVADGNSGVTYSKWLNFLDGSNGGSSFTPDSSGNYISNDDYNTGGHYYTEVGTDAAGNTTYNYYYYGDDNSRHEITAKDSYNNTYTDNTDNSTSGGGGGGTASGDNSNNNVNNPTFNNNNNVNVTVEGDTFNNDVDNIINNDSSNSKDNSDSFIGKFLSFFKILDDNSFLGVLGKIFGWLPSPVFSVITGAIGIVAGVAVFRFFRK